MKGAYVEKSLSEPEQQSTVYSLTLLAGIERVEEILSIHASRFAHQNVVLAIFLHKMSYLRFVDDFVESFMDSSGFQLIFI